MTYFLIFQCLLLFTCNILISCDVEYTIDSDKPKIPELNLKRLCSDNIDQFLNYFQKTIDVNQDANVDRTELHDTLLKQVKNIHENEIKEELQELRLTNLNQISFNAYAKVTFENYKELEEGGLADQDFREIKNLYEIERKKWMFIAGDSMQGQLNKTQFYSFIYSDEYPHVHEFELRIMFNQFDVNSDGALDVNEFTEGVQTVDESLVTSKSKRFTRTLDQDGNNLLSRAEFQSWYYPSIEQKLNDEINFLLDSYDSDSDGYLQRKELIEHCDALAASQLTNFGLVFHAMENSSRKVEL